MKKWKLVSGLGGLALVLAIVGVWLFGGTAAVSASEATADDLQTLTQSTTGPGPLGNGYLAHGGRGGRDGLLRLGDGTIDYDQLLADALGITVKELQAAREKANQAAIEQALEEGLITQEQVDQMQAREELGQARKDVQSYLDREALMASALGISIEELQAALAEGKTYRDLVSELELELATVREKLQAAVEAALAQAVKDGVITQEQADAMQDNAGRGFDLGPRGFDQSPRGFDRDNVPLPEDFQGKGRPHGRGGSGDREPLSPDTDDDTSGTRLGRPGRASQDAGAL